MVVYLLFRLAGFVAPRIPRRLGYAFAGVASALMYRMSAGSRRMMQCNVRRALGAEANSAEVERITKRIFHNLVKNYFDLFWMPAQSDEKMAKLITVYNYDNCRAAIARGKGMIAVSAHLGNQEVMIHARAITEFNLTLVVEHLKNERVFNYLVSLRSGKSGLHMVPQDGALRELFRALRRNEIIGLVFDRNVSGAGRIAPFFGQPARLPDGYAVLSLKLGAAIVPAFIVREPDDSYSVHVEKPIVIEGKADNDADVLRVMASVGEVVERFVSAHIEQWVYFHYVWEEDREREQTHRGQTERATAG
jgi:lauroyl/myristoyl acyltransferase